MARCQKCGKSRSVGRKSRHRRGVASKKFANKATKKSRLFRPNLQKISFMAGGLALTMVLCAKCIKKMKREKTTPKIKGKRPNLPTGGKVSPPKTKSRPKPGGDDNKKAGKQSRSKAKKLPAGGKKKK